MGLLATKPAARLIAAPLAATLLAVVALAPLAEATQIDLSLNLTYSNPIDPTSGGAWEVVAVADEQGLALLGFSLAGTTGSATSGLPSATVDNGADNTGGFNIFQDVSSNEVLAITAAQAHDPGSLGSGEELGAFYGVGLVSNGQPDTIGPALATLSAGVNLPWSAAADPFGRAAFDNAVSVATGSFDAEQTPAFTGALLGQLYTSIGTTSSLGSLASATSITTTVASNLVNPDFNGDGLVDAADYTLWRDTQGMSVPAGTGADGNSDGMVDIADYTLWKDNFGAMIPSSAAPAAAPTPEPTSAAILFAGLASSTLFRRQKQGVVRVQGVLSKKLQYAEKLLDTLETPSHNATN